MVLKGQGCQLGSGRGHAAPEAPNRGSPSVSLASMGIGWGSGSISVLLQPGTSKQPSNLTAHPCPCGVLSGCFGVLALPELSTTLRGLNSRKTSSYLFGQNYMEPNLVCVHLKPSFVWGLSKARTCYRFYGEGQETMV